MNWISQKVKARKLGRGHAVGLDAQHMKNLVGKTPSQAPRPQPARASMLQIEGVSADRCFRLLMKNAIHHVSNHLQLHLGLWLIVLLIVLLNLGACDGLSCTSPGVGRHQG